MASKLNMVSFFRFIGLCFLAFASANCLPSANSVNSANSANFADLKDACSDCKANMSSLGKFLTMDEVISATVDSFNRDLCPYYSNDTKGCQKNVTEIWPLMAKALFVNPVAQRMVCEGMKMCKTEQKFEWPIISR